MKITLTTRQPIPKQSLDDKVGFIAIITGVYPYVGGARCNRVNFNESEKVLIEINNEAGKDCSGGSAISYSKKDFETLAKAYNIFFVPEVFDPDSLVGKPALTLYHNGMISGIVPLTRTTKISLG
ncbi:hypothetical protein J4429_00425 [Candidatus Pacearchaeota archaeon]|nr:hypothetical protein [uncultured archaeon]MBS3074902.1 hypothetical protein [Candidatus Pacearchaeota archaeon]AQS32571.1 hypothetical protein [uncultured archaeon]AQS33059.1 hypothetical protein [uncultured archaeon]AQS34688.1 hypothetical protein [uncultured archaeon]